MDLAAFVERSTGARIVRRERLRGLWGGYGEIARLWLGGGAIETAILKEVAPPRGPRAGEEGRSHARKCRSYDVEVRFYEAFAPRAGDGCRVARCFGARAGGSPGEERWWLLLEDLDAAGFDARRARGGELAPCVRWLAAFHAAFLGAAPDGLWPEGSYWHLATRPDELARTPGLRGDAARWDRALADARFRTLVHGDAKPANFCFAGDGRAAAVDFQYVGGGSGMRDLAYLLHGAPAREADRALGAYFGALAEALGGRGVDAAEVEREGRRLYPIAVADFDRFLAGWRG